MRCAIYTRVSTDEQAMSEYNSLKRQEEICRNPVYKGFVRYGGMLYPGKHEAIVDEESWEQANKAIGNGHEDDTGL